MRTLKVFAGEGGAEDVLWVEDVAKFFFGEAVQSGEEGAEFGAETSAVGLIPLEK